MPERADSLSWFLLSTHNICLFMPEERLKASRHRYLLAECKYCDCSYPAVLALVFGAQRDGLLETVLLSTHSTCLITTHLKI